MWVRFLSRFAWAATPATTIVYKPDETADGRFNVTRRCAAEAIAAGKAESCERPERRIEVHQ